MALPPLIPRSVLFGNPDRMSPTLSPDGTRLGFVAPEDGVLNIWVGPADGSRAAVAVTDDRDRGIRDYLFCHDDRHLVYLQDTAGDEDWRLYALDLTSGESRLLTPENKVHAQIIGHNRWHPTTMLVALNARRVGVTGDEWEPLLEIPADDATTTGAIGFNREGDALFLLTSMDANATRLVRMGWRDGSRTVISEDPQYDVADVWRDPLTREPQAVVLDESRTRIVVLDPALETDVKTLRDLGDGELNVGRQDRADRRWLVSVSPSDGPMRFHLYDRDAGATTYLFAHKDALDDYELASMEPFSFVARDGLTVHGYLTFPRGDERQGLPAVVNVHGGPWVRDRWGYDPEAQWLANRGYACVQVNYRGSTGYGKAFLKAGDKQWGRAMHDDLVDAVNHVVQQGWVDPARVGISGGSYGGYAALAGAAFTPDVFRCAIDLVGPSNLLTLLASIPDYWAPMRAMLYQRVGNLETEADMLWERSPLAHVDAIRIPVLVAQGANDPRVKQAEAEQIVAALIEKGFPHEYLLFEDEGHGLAKPENRERYYEAAERFLAEHLGGRTA